MAHSNGRIYTETVSGVRRGVTTEDVAAVLGVNSLDVATLCRAANINPWARYKPVPCIHANGNDVPGILTPSQRSAELYGLEALVDHFTADTDQQYENYANSIDFDSQYGGVRKRSWSTYGSVWCRLLDFVKSSTQGAIVDSVGYDHNARPDTVTVTHGGTAYTLQPLIPAVERTMTIAAGSTREFPFPNDSVWLPTYLGIINGTIQESQNYKIERGHGEEWLSVLDLISGNTYSQLTNGSIIRRGVLIFKRNASGVWKLVTQAYAASGNHASVFSLTDASKSRMANDGSSDTTKTVLRAGSTALTALEGSLLFVDIWFVSPVNVVPIVGFAYEVNITRGSGGDTGSIDIEGLIVFLGATKVAVEGGDAGDYTVRLHYQAKSTAAMSTWFNFIQAAIVNAYSTDTYTLTTATPVEVDHQGSWYHCYIDLGDYSYPTQVTVTAARTGETTADRTATFTVEAEN